MSVLRASLFLLNPVLGRDEVDVLEGLIIALLVLVVILIGSVLVLLLKIDRKPVATLDSSVLAQQLQNDFRAQRQELQLSLNQLRSEQSSQISVVQDLVGEKLRSYLGSSLQDNSDRIHQLMRANSELHIQLQTLLRDELTLLRQSNEQKLEKMRETVDEKLQSTLEKRLGDSFSLVSERLEQVQKGLGEMQSLASDVGGLKRVLSNVKTRGSWGEVQLERQLSDILTPDQYEQNVAITPHSNDRVEFAVRLPGEETNGSPVYLAIDSKFPQEDYERLLVAQEAGEREQIEIAARALERAVLAQAKLISSKYIDPPHSTDFAILYVPTEGLFAELIRMPGLSSKLQNELRVMITGPTTLMSLLNSLQMGFRALAISKRSSEAWQVLSAAKAQFQKYEQVWQRLAKQLHTAQKTAESVATRTRAVERTLRAVEANPEAVGTEGIAELLDEVLQGGADHLEEAE